MRFRPSYDSGSMKTAVYAFATMILGLGLCPSLNAQAPANPPVSSTNLAQQDLTAPPGPVPLSEEPHHRLVLQNDFARVYNVMVAALDSTLRHQHELPYLYVTLGPADIINAISGQPELHQVLQDGEAHYSPGHFAHLVRTDSGMPFHNVTIELVHPQGTLKNLCKDVVAAAPLNCEEKKPEAESAPAEPVNAGVRKKGSSAASRSKAKNEQTKAAPIPDGVPYFESEEVRVDLHKVSSGADYVDARPQNDALLVALTDANLDANLAGEHILFLHGGDALWLPAGKHRRIVDFLGTHSGFLLISFKDSAAAPATQ